jgi:pimeloyl-ACP methyl ester carboxylesterase
VSRQGSCQFDTGVGVLSGLDAWPDEPPRGVILALHGSGYTAGYWDGPHDSSTSLLKLGRAVGFRVVAVDRPGYGASRGLPGSRRTLDAQAEVLGALAVSVTAESGSVPLFLVGHSMGSLLAVRLAAVEAIEHVVGLEVSGLPARWRPEMRAAVEELLAGRPTALSTGIDRLATYFGPVGSFDPRVLEVESTFSQRIPRLEMAQSLESPSLLPRLAPRVVAAVHYTMAEFEGSIPGGPDGLAYGLSLFSGAARTVANVEPNAGHNVSLHRGGRAYHLRVLAFFEELIAQTARSGPEANDLAAINSSG